MKNKINNILDYFKENIVLENKIKQCSSVADIIKAVLTSEYFQNLNTELHIKDWDEEITNNNGKKEYYINVNFQINMALRVFKIYNLIQGNFHKHDYYEFVYVASGQLEQIINNKKVVLKQGEGCILSPRVIHCDSPIGEEDVVLYFCFSKTMFLEEVYPEIKGLSTYNFVGENQYILFQNLIEIDNLDIILNILREYFEEDTGCKYFILGYIIRLFHKILKQCEEISCINIIYDANTELFLTIEEYIEQNISTVSRKMLAEELHYNANYINTVIKQNSGLTYCDYVSHKRLDLAIQMLRESTASINKIIEKVGYINKSHFYKVFYNKYGITPNEFRKIIN